MVEQGETIEGLAKRYLQEKQPNLKQFIDESFLLALLNAGKEPDESQARAAITGDTFEKCLQYIFEFRYPNLTIERNVPLPEACMTGSGGADFVIYKSIEKQTIVAVIEAKGSADTLQWPNGTTETFSRPGLQRSDTVKKAVCQAYQIKKAYPETCFYILTTHLPSDSTASNDILQMAEGDIIDGVIDATQASHLDTFVSTL